MPKYQHDPEGITGKQAYRVDIFYKIAGDRHQLNHGNVYFGSINTHVF